MAEFVRTRTTAQGGHKPSLRMVRSTRTNAEEIKRKIVNLHGMNALLHKLFKVEKLA